MSIVNMEFVTTRVDLPPEWIDVTLSNGRVVRYCKEAANRPLGSNPEEPRSLSLWWFKWLKEQRAADLHLVNDEMGVVEKGSGVVGACYDEGPYWNLDAGDYLLVPIGLVDPPKEERA